MLHYFNKLESKEGTAQVGKHVRLRNAAGVEVALFSDNNGTPISTVSGFANTAITSDLGNFDFYVADGKYGLFFFEPDGTQIGEPIVDVSMFERGQAGIGGIDFATPAAGIAATEDGQAFFVENTDNTVGAYVNENGVAALKWTAIAASGTAAINADRVGVTSGTTPTNVDIWIKRQPKTPYDYGAVGGYETVTEARAGVDDIVAINNLLAAWTADSNIVPDFGGRYWNVSSNVRFEQSGDDRASYAIGGSFVASNGSSGDNLITIATRYGSIEGEIAAYGTGGAAYAGRTWNRGIFLDDSSRVRVGAWVAENFKRDGFSVFQPVAANNNIASNIGPGRALNCGSALGQATTLLTQGFTAVANSGSSGSTAQRAALTMDAPVPAEISVFDLCFYNDEPYIITAKSGSTLTVHPWLPNGVTAGTITYGHGAGLRVAGSNTASCHYGLVEGFRCGTVLLSSGLYAGKFDGVQSQVSGAALVIGNPLSSASWGAQIGYFHAESTEFDIIGTSTSPYRASIANPSAMGTQSGETIDLLAQSMQIAARATDNSYSATLSTFKGIEIGGIAGPLVGGLTGITRGVTVSTLQLSNLPSERSKTQIRNTQSIRLKWFPHIDRALYNHNSVEAFVYGTGTGNGPTGVTTITLDADDQAAGVTVNGGTSVTIPANANALHIHALMNNAGTTRNWLVSWVDMNRP